MMENKNGRLVVLACSVTVAVMAAFGFLNYHISSQVKGPSGPKRTVHADGIVKRTGPIPAVDTAQAMRAEGFESDPLAPVRKQPRAVADPPSAEEPLKRTFDVAPQSAILVQ
ncbi:MAG TPA: hypothetical protein P5246_03390 [Candidatus Omnitrophota bacterium]|nr:hypothetical protein [Candidatus Omnitrophota bacterium]HSA31794.1 hypothetical protein [Candidatus Omnitrophota bacterium]